MFWQTLLIGQSFSSIQQFSVHLTEDLIWRGVILNIPFWSNEKRSGTTANLAAVSVMCTLKSAYRVTLLENHYSEKNLGKMLLPFPKAHLVKEEVIYYLGHGISDCLVPKVIKSDCIRAGGPFLEILEERLYYMLQMQAAGNLFELEFANLILPMLRKKEQMAQLWMIDTECNQNVSSKILLNEAELIVVTLRKEFQSIVNFIKNFSEIKQKSIFLITDFEHYKQDSELDSLFKEEFQKEQLIFVPNCPEFKEALNQGRCVEFISSHIGCTTEESCYIWIRTIESVADLILMRCRKKVRDSNGEEME